MDFGSKRIGLSLSDPLGIIATPYATIQNDKTVWVRLRDIIARESVRYIVVGMPRNLRGEQSHKAREVETFVSRIKSETALEVFTWDERYTTIIAQQTLIDMNTKKKGRNAKSGQLDSMAAALILQDFLDSTKRSKSC
jgi:putative Holliday junction resolvase